MGALVCYSDMRCPLIDLSRGRGWINAYLWLVDRLLVLSVVCKMLLAQGHWCLFLS